MAEFPPGSGSALSGDGHTGRRDLGGMLGQWLGAPKHIEFPVTLRPEAGQSLTASPSGKSLPTRLKLIRRGPKS